MTISRSLCAIATCFTLGGFTSGGARAEQTLTITLDTPPGHVRNAYIAQFAEALTERWDGALTVDVFDACTR